MLLPCLKLLFWPRSLRLSVLTRATASHWHLPSLRRSRRRLVLNFFKHGRPLLNAATARGGEIRIHPYMERWFACVNRRGSWSFLSRDAFHIHPKGHGLPHRIRSCDPNADGSISCKRRMRLTSGDTKLRPMITCSNAPTNPPGATSLSSASTST
jgi:hypothetical protein